MLDNVIISILYSDCVITVIWIFASSLTGYVSVILTWPAGASINHLQFALFGYSPFPPGDVIVPDESVNLFGSPPPHGSTRFARLPAFKIINCYRSLPNLTINVKWWQFYENTRFSREVSVSCSSMLIIIFTQVECAKLLIARSNQQIQNVFITLDSNKSITCQLPLPSSYKRHL